MLGHGRRTYTGFKLILFFLALFAGLSWLMSNALDALTRH